MPTTSPTAARTAATLEATVQVTETPVEPTMIDIPRFAAEIQKMVFDYAVFTNNGDNSPPEENVLLIALKSNASLHALALESYWGHFDKVITRDNEAEFKALKMVELRKIKHITIQACGEFEEWNVPQIPRLKGHKVQLINEFKSITIEICPIAPPSSQQDKTNNSDYLRPCFQESFVTCYTLCNASVAGCYQIFVKVPAPTNGFPLVDRYRNHSDSTVKWVSEPREGQIGIASSTGHWVDEVHNGVGTLWQETPLWRVWCWERADGKPWKWKKSMGLP